MTTTEFKAWFEGYTEHISKVPTQKQWKRIIERVAEVEGDTHHCDHYTWQPWYPEWFTMPNVTPTYSTWDSGTINVPGPTNCNVASNLTIAISSDEYETDMAYLIGSEEAARDSA